MADTFSTTGTLTLAEHIVRVPRLVSWEPKEDITAFELARAMMVLISKSYDLDLHVAALPAEVARHFVVK